MQIVTYINSKKDILQIKNKNIKEAIIGPSVFSRFGTVSLAECRELAKMCLEKGIKPILEWDILMTDDVFNIKKDIFFKNDWSDFSSIRLQDPGVLNFILESDIDLKIQLNLESGNHNLEGIRRYEEMAKEKLERLILSIELPKEKLKNYVANIKTPVEFLGLGRILLFYTPRSLVSHYIDHDDSEMIKVNERPIEVTGSSEESPHSGFPIIENSHGTFMFNIKDHFVLEGIEEILQMGLHSLRIDLRFEDSIELINEVAGLLDSPSVDDALLIKEKYPRNVIRGFYNVNKSNVLFKKLKNSRLQRQDQTYIGDVLEVNKKNHFGVLIRNEQRELRVGQDIKIVTPDGKVKFSKVNFMKNSSHQDLEIATNGQVVFIPHVSGVSVRSAVYSHSN